MEHEPDELKLVPSERKLKVQFYIIEFDPSITRPATTIFTIGRDHPLLISDVKLKKTFQVIFFHGIYSYHSINHITPRIYLLKKCNLIIFQQYIGSKTFCRGMVQRVAIVLLAEGT